MIGLEIAFEIVYCRMVDIQTCHATFVIVLTY